MSTTEHRSSKKTGKMSIDNLIAVEELAKQLKLAAEGIKKKPDLMKSSAGYMELVHEDPGRGVHGDAGKPGLSFSKDGIVASPVMSDINERKRNYDHVS